MKKMLTIIICPLVFFLFVTSLSAKPNGCGAEGGIKFPSNPANANFDYACNKHDSCYGKCGANKSQCDSAFKVDMVLSCAKHIRGLNLPPIPKERAEHRCASAVESYYRAVKTFGDNAFKVAQKTSCNSTSVHDKSDSIGIPDIGYQISKTSRWHYQHASSNVSNGRDQCDKRPSSTIEKEYEFSTARPPLFSRGEHRGGVLDIESDLLTKVIGTASWETKVFCRGCGGGSGFRPPSFDVYYTYTATRSLRWKVAVPIVHYPQKITKVINEVKGYEKSTMDLFTKTTSLSINAGLQSAFSAEVARTLQITNQVNERWHEQITTNIEWVYDADTTYVHWVLVDEIKVDRVQHFRNRNGGPWRQQNEPSSTVDSTVNHYYEKYKLLENCTSRDSAKINV